MEDQKEEKKELKETTNLNDVLGDINLDSVESSISSEEFDEMLKGSGQKPEEKKEEEKKETTEEKTEVKEEEKEEQSSEEETESSLFDELDAITGYKIEGEFDDSVEGLAKRTLAVAEKVVEQEFGNFFEEHPDIAEYLKYKELGGNIKDYLETKFPKLDYNTLEISEDDINSQKSIVATGLRKQGYSEDKIAEKIKRYESSGVLFQEATDTKETLALEQKAEQEEILKRQEEINQEELKKQEAYLKQIEDSILKNNSFAGIVIPEAEKKKFYDHITKPVNKEGYTQYQLDTLNDSIEDRLALLYLRYKKFNLNDVVERKAKTLQAKKVSEMIKSSKEKEALKSKTPEVETDNIKEIFN